MLPFTTNYFVMFSWPQFSCLRFTLIPTYQPLPSLHFKTEYKNMSSDETNFKKKLCAHFQFFCVSGTITGRGFYLFQKGCIKSKVKFGEQYICWPNYIEHPQGLLQCCSLWNCLSEIKRFDHLTILTILNGV